MTLDTCSRSTKDTVDHLVELDGLTYALKVLLKHGMYKYHFATGQTKES